MSVTNLVQRNYSTHFDKLCSQITNKINLHANQLLKKSKFAKQEKFDIIIRALSASNQPSTFLIFLTYLRYMNTIENEEPSADSLRPK